jgi:hypothetical protein
MPPARVWWHGLGAFVVTFSGAFLALAATVSGTQAHITLLAWGVLGFTALGAGATAMKAAWPEASNTHT